MDFLANENFPLVSVNRLRQQGYDVTAVIEDSPGAKDQDILIQANQEQRIILTFDRDYGELIYKLMLSAPKGVIYFRFRPSAPEEPAEFVLRLLAMDRFSLTGKFTVAERDRVRQRYLP